LIGSNLCGDSRSLCLQRSQPHLGVADKFSQTGFGTWVFGIAQNGAHTHNTVTEPIHFIFNFDGHGCCIAQIAAGILRELQRPVDARTADAERLGDIGRPHALRLQFAYPCLVY
jgi:hypothetical protein